MSRQSMKVRLPNPVDFSTQVNVQLAIFRLFLRFSDRSYLPDQFPSDRMFLVLLWFREGFADRFFQRVGNTVSCGRPVSDEAKKRCFDLGRELLRKLSES